MDFVWKSQGCVGDGVVSFEYKIALYERNPLAPKQPSVVKAK